jgi:hypothetical protein
LSRKDGTIDARAPVLDSREDATARTPRWSIVPDVLQWME